MTNALRFAALPAFIFAMAASSVAFGETTGQYVDDATLTTKVKAALLADQPLKAIKVSVETDHGVVHLAGSVNTKDQESEAVKVANQVSGVKSVEDMITVTGSDARD